MPPATAELVIQVQVLLVYARHLLGMLRYAAERGIALLEHIRCSLLHRICSSPWFDRVIHGSGLSAGTDHALAQCFGVAQASFVLTNLSRGILRAIALERVLSARADAQAAGEPDPAAAKPHRRTAPQARNSAPHPPRSPSQLPTLRQLEAAIRRRPVDWVIDDISRDLGTAFSLCDARFGHALRDMAAAYRDSISNVFNQCLPHAAATADAPEQNTAFALPPQKPGAIRYIVGCLRAQQPVCGFPFTAWPPGAATAGAQPP